MTTEDRPLYDVIIIGAGVIGPCLAKNLARQGRKVLIAEREWSRPNRIVGELMQPSGLKALKQLGMIKAINNIDAIEVDGYYIEFDGQEVLIDYPSKNVESALDNSPVPDAIKKGDEDKIGSDSTISAKRWEESPNVKGAGFTHGDFLMNLRAQALAEPNVTKLDGNVTGLVKDDQQRVCGITVADQGVFKGRLIINCDGIYSKFRKEIGEDYVPTVGSYFVGMELTDADLPAPHHGHVLLGKHAPVLMYQIDPHHSRVLCAYRSKTLPRRADVLKYLHNDVLPQLPKKLQPSFEAALNKDGQDIYKAMPNQYLTARLNNNPGFICIGDSLNMRHPLTGGGMTVGLNDAVLFLKMIADVKNEDLDNEEIILEKMIDFHNERKSLDVIINTLSIALYTLFAADSRYLTILQRGVFAYFLRGGSCVEEPIGLLSGLIPSIWTLFFNFFAVAFYACRLNIQARGIIGFPLALFENVGVLITASFVLLPLLLKEILS
ncbi:DEKNAAC105183 [Brettanomyces naardenensis]|uniref:Squalene monooxygenase n=1 Tax=Brettanomyces naardenensis TaxID=13370 RepID=A0A448YSP4_BRENA|nr:DEKNAAC105183 [Brettanomyces naardenensis]